LALFLFNECPPKEKKIVGWNIMYSTKHDTVTELRQKQRKTERIKREANLKLKTKTVLGRILHGASIGKQSNQRLSR